MLDADSRATIEEAAAPETEIGDLVFVDGRLWHVRCALASSATVTLQLKAAQRADISVGGDDVVAYLAGDAGSGEPVVALAAAGVLRRGDVVDVDGSAYAVAAPTRWPAGDLSRYVLTPA